MRMALYCDFMTEMIRPLQLILRTDLGELDWSKTLYLPLSGPFERFDPEDFEDQIGVSVLLGDLILPKEEESLDDPSVAGQFFIPKRLGINLPRIASRHPGAEMTLLAVQISDAEEVLGFAWETWLSV